MCLRWSNDDDRDYTLERECAGRKSGLPAVGQFFRVERIRTIKGVLCVGRGSFGNQPFRTGLLNNDSLLTGFARTPVQRCMHKTH